MIDMAARRLRSGQFMQVHRRIAERCLSQAGIEALQVSQIAEQLQTAIRTELGGAKFYITMGKPEPGSAAARAGALQAQGLSVADIAARLNVSKGTVYRLLAIARNTGE